MKDSVNHPVSIVAAVLLVAFSALVINISPIVVGTAANEKILPVEQLGMLIVPGVIAVILASVFMVRWIRQVNWKWLVAIGGCVSAVGYLGATASDSLYGLFVGLFFAGLGCGVLYAVAMCSLGDTKDPDRSFGYAAVAQTLISAMALYSIPMWLVPRWGFDGLLALFSVVGVISFALFYWFPSRGSLVPLEEVIPEPSADGEHSSLLAWLALIAVYLFFTGTSVLWTFYERFASDLGFSQDYIAKTLSVAVMIGGLGAFVPAFLGSRYKRFWLILITNVCLLITLFLLAGVADESTFYLLSIFFYFFVSMALPYGFAAVAAVDVKGNVVVLIPATMAVAAGTGAVVGGPLYVMGSSVLLTGTALIIFLGLMVHVVLNAVDSKRVLRDNTQVKDVVGREV